MKVGKFNLIHSCVFEALCAALNLVGMSILLLRSAFESMVALAPPTLIGKPPD
jgi:hypothetical protein